MSFVSTKKTLIINILKGFFLNTLAFKKHIKNSKVLQKAVIEINSCIKSLDERILKKCNDAFLTHKEIDELIKHHSSKVVRLSKRQKRILP